MGIKDQRMWVVAAALWGFAEATFFFIVPDLLLTASILFFGFAFALRLAGIAAVGAVLGGMVMYGWSASAGSPTSFLLSIPLIGEDLLTRVAGEMGSASARPWPVSLTLGAISGAPYKLYAVEAGALGINPVFFAVVSLFARGLRFVLAIAIAGAGFALAERLGLKFLRGPGLVIAWGAIYALYATIRLSIP